MKKLFYYMAAVSAIAFGAVSCSEDKSYDDPFPAKIDNYQLNGDNNGKWMLISIDGTALPEGLYQYVIFDTGENEFEFIQNLNSQGSVSLTGVYTLTYDEYEGNILSGDYDHASGPWANEYVITEISGSSMTWTVLGDPDSYYVYTTCSEIPEELVPDIKSM